MDELLVSLLKVRAFVVLHCLPCSRRLSIMCDIILTTLRCFQVLQSCIRPVDDLDVYQRHRESKHFSWRPFRDPKSASEAGQLICERIFSANPPRDTDAIRSRSRSVVAALLSSSALTERLATSSSTAVMPLFHLWQDCLVSSLQEVESCSSTRVRDRVSIALRCAPQILALVPASDLRSLASSMFSLSSAFSGRKDGGADCELYTAALVALGSSAPGFRALCSVGLVTEWSKRLVDYMLERAPVFHDAASFVTWSRDLGRGFLASDFVADGMCRAITELRDSGDFSIAVGSSRDECPTSLRRIIQSFSFTRCLLASPFAPDVLVGNDMGARNTLMELIRETLRRHGASCCANSDAEDTCCVALQFVISLVSAIPSKLKCWGFLSELGLLDLGDSKASAPREPIDGIGACSYLEHKLRYELENVGGPSERARWRDLHDVDSQTLADAAVAMTARENAGQFQVQRGCLTASLDELKHDLLAALGGPVPLDSLSHLAWELIGKLERHSDARALASVLGDLLMAIVKSEHSPLARATANGSASFEPTSCRPRTSELDWFPPAAQRKMLNRMYKIYCLKMSLPSFPTRLHSIVKQFGSAAIDCFPVTMLMLLGDVCEDDGDVLAVLSQCYNSPLARYLWPATAGVAVDGRATPSSVALTEAIEWVLAREFPQVRRLTRRRRTRIIRV